MLMKYKCDVFFFFFFSEAQVADFFGCIVAFV